MIISEQEQISKLREGDRESFEIIFQGNYKNLVLYAKKFVMDTEVARDIVQDIFIYLWEKRQDLTINKSLSSYLFRAVRNACINHLKRESSKKKYIIDFLINLNEASSRTSKSEDAHELVVHKDLSKRIEKIVETLPEQCRNIFKMSRFRGMKNKEIAEIYAISPRTVETQIYRALKVLKENLRLYMSITTALIPIFIKSL